MPSWSSYVALSPSSRVIFWRCRKCCGNVQFRWIPRFEHWYRPLELICWNTFLPPGQYDERLLPALLRSGSLGQKTVSLAENKNGLMCWINAISARLSGYRENTAPRLPKLQGRLTARWNSEGREGSGVASAKLSRYLCLPGGMSSMVACVVVLHFSRAGRPLELFPFFRPPAASPLPLSHFHRCTGTCMF